MRPSPQSLAPPRARAPSRFHWFAWLCVALMLLLATRPALAASFRYASSSNRIYVEGGGSATLSDIKAALPGAPLLRVDPVNAVWLLNAHLFVDDGTVLRLHGTAIGGDVNELRLRSDNTTAAGAFVQITADHGHLDLRATRLRSWDAAAGGPDTEYSTYGRAFVRVRSSLATDGVTPLESRMDVVDSEISHLGYPASEAYGLVWKVLGSPATTPDLYERVQVRGDILRSRIHHNYFGVYTFGHQDGVWRDNEVYANVQYGIDPHDDSDNLLIENNDVHHNGNHGIIASKRCDHAVIRNNRSWANAGNGIMLHRASDDARVEDNQAFDNGDSGIALFASARALVRNNILTGNANAGMRLSMGAADNVIEENVIGGSGRYGLYFYRGSDEPEPGDDGRPKRNTFRDNHVFDSLAEGIKMSDGDGNRFLDNRFENNGGRFWFANSSAVELANNQLPDDLLVEASGTSLEVSRQPRMRLALASGSSARFSDAGGAVFEAGTLATLAEPGGTQLSIGAGDLSPGSIVLTRALGARPRSGSVAITPTAWEAVKSWNARAPGRTQPVVDYVVGELVPGGRYRVLRNGTPLLDAVADSGGRVRFAATVLKGKVTGFSVEPQS